MWSPRQLTHGLRVLLGRRRADQELDDEIRHFLDEAKADAMAQGASAKDADTLTRQRHGRATVIRERVRAGGWEHGVETLIADLRYGARGLVSRPGFTAVACLTLALGITATTVVFSVVDSFVLRSVPFRDPDQLAEIWVWGERGGGPMQPGEMMARWRDQTQLFESVEAHWEHPFILEGENGPAITWGSQVTVGLLPMLGVAPQLGRTFAPDETDEPLVVIGHRLWLQRFGGDPEAIGQPLRLDDRVYTIIGVMPAEFRFPVGRIELWLPFDPPGYNPLSPRGGTTPLVRLRDGLSLLQADEQVAVLAPQLDPTLADRPGMSARLQTLRRFSPESLAARAGFQGTLEPRRLLLLIFGASGLVLLAACANAANLFYARALGRSRELAVRAALGGSRGRLLRQVLLDAGLVAALAAGVGLLLSNAAIGILTSVIPGRLTEASLNPLGLDARTALWAVVVSTIAGLIAALVPALSVTGRDVIAPLTRREQRPHGHHRSRGLLVSLQAAVAVVLVVGAGLAARSLYDLVNADTGWSDQGVLVIGPQFRGERFQEQPSQMAFMTEATERLRRLPGVRQVALAESVPLQTHRIWAGTLDTESGPGAEAELTINYISENYFAALGITVERAPTGGGFGDSGSDAAIVTRDFADRLWPARSPIGQGFRMGDEGDWQTVAGVVNDVQSMGHSAQIDPLEVYLPLVRESAGRPRFLVVQTDGRAGQLGLVRSEMQALAPELVMEVRPLEDIYSGTLATPRFQALLFGAFALVVLLLSSAGVYASVAYEVRRQRHDMGVRIALGATRSRVARLVVGRSIGLVVVGIVAGLAAAGSLTGLASSWLHGVDTVDPAILVAAALALLLASVAASALPARRANRIDPIETLRAE